MRVTIGERLGIRREVTRVQSVPVVDRLEIEATVSVEDRIVLASCPSSSIEWGERRVREDDGGPPRVRGEMIWLHKTAPTLVIEGRGDLSPEEHAAGRRR